MNYKTLLLSLLMCPLSLSFNAYSMQAAKQAELSWDDEEFVVPSMVTAPTAPVVKNEPVKKETEAKANNHFKTFSNKPLTRTYCIGPTF